MDDTLQDLENELKRLSPRQPSAAFLARLECALGPASRPVAPRRYSSATSWRSWKWAGWSLAGALTAAAIIMAVITTHRPAAAPVSPSAAELAQGQPESRQPDATVVAANRYEPVQATSILYDMREDGTAVLPDQTEGRQVRYRYVDTYTWRNPATNASLQWRVPREEVRLVRASLD